MTDIESDLEAFCAAQEETKRPRCLVCGLPEDIRKAVEGSTRTSTDITRWLGIKGHRLSADSLQRHRRGVCRGR